MKIVHRTSYKVPLFFQILLKLEFSRQNLKKKYSNVKCHESPFIGTRVVPCGRTDITQLILTFRNFANAPENHSDVNWFRASDSNLVPQEYRSVLSPLW